MSKASLFQRLGKVADRRSELVGNALKSQGVNLDETLPKFKQARESLWNGAIPVIRTDAEGMQGIFNTGRFKNYLETGKTNGGTGFADAGTGRRYVEDKLYGSFDDDSQRPIYGYMESHYSNPTNPNPEEIRTRTKGSFSDYGNVKFYPKRDFTRKNSTYTLGDSQFGQVYPGRWDYDDWQAIGARFIGSDGGKMRVTPPGTFGWKLDRLERAKDPRHLDSSGAELQYPGGITMNDIESVSIPEGLDESIKQAAIEAANKYGFRLDENDIREIVTRCLANCIE